MVPSKIAAIDRPYLKHKACKEIGKYYFWVDGYNECTASCKYPKAGMRLAILAQNYSYTGSVMINVEPSLSD
jgi:hypothetical protein